MDTGLSSYVGNDVQLQSKKERNDIPADGAHCIYIYICVYLEQSDVCGVVRMDEETLQVGLKH